MKSGPIGSPNKTEFLYTNQHSLKNNSENHGKKKRTKEYEKMAVNQVFVFKFQML